MPCQKCRELSEIVKSYSTWVDEKDLEIERLREGLEIIQSFTRDKEDWEAKDIYEAMRDIASTYLRGERRGLE